MEPCRGHGVKRSQAAAAYQARNDQTLKTGLPLAAATALHWRRGMNLVIPHFAKCEILCQHAAACSGEAPASDGAFAWRSGRFVVQRTLPRAKRFFQRLCARPARCVGTGDM